MNILYIRCEDNKNALIIGLKEINLEKLNVHTHMYFSHSFTPFNISKADISKIFYF